MTREWAEHCEKCDAMRRTDGACTFSLCRLASEIELMADQYLDENYGYVVNDNGDTCDPDGAGMYINDWMAYYRIADCVREGHMEDAEDFAENMDTYPRSLIPNSFYEELEFWQRRAR